MKQTFTKLFCAVLLLTAGMATAQTPFYSENFTNGFPTGWTTTDTSSNGVLWEYCVGPSSACVNLYGNADFASTTAGGGFMVLDSDGAGELGAGNQHISQLTTGAVNCTGAAEVFVTFENYVGVFATASTGTVLLRVSTNGTTWTEFDVIPGLTQNNRFSSNPYLATFDISSIAANQSVVYLQWQWSGNYEYWWMLDDVKVFAEDPTSNNDLVLGDFFYPVSSYATPESQIATDTFGFYGFVSNRGAVDQYNVTLFAFVFDTLNNVVFEDSAAIAVLPAGYLDTFIQLPNRYVPELGIGRYSVVYAVFSDSTDARPDDNVDGDFFEVTANRFAKERGPTSASQPGSGGDYAFANLYQMSSASQEQYRAVSFVFATAVNPGTIPLEDLEVTASLFKVKDEVLPDFSNFDETAFMSPSLDWVGTAGYEFPTGAANYELQTVEIVDLTTGEVGVLLENGARYFAAVEYAGVNNVAFHATSDETTHYFLSTLVYTEATGWFAGYSDDFNAVIRMNIDLVTSIDEKPLPETALVVMPNPIQTELNLQVGFDQSTDATITIAEVSGRVIKIDRRKGLTNDLLTYNLPQLANGAYLARIATAQGTSTKKFVVQK